MHQNQRINPQKISLTIAKTQDQLHPHVDQVNPFNSHRHDKLIMSKKYIDISDLFSRNNLPQTFIKSQSTGNLPEESYTYDPFKSYTYAPFERPTQTPPVTWRQFKSFQTYLFSCLRNRCSTLLNYFIIAIHKNIRSNYAK